MQSAGKSTWSNTDELVAAHPRHVAALRSFLKPPGRLAHGISTRMTEPIIDLLEVVEVDAHDSEAGPGALGPFDRGQEVLIQGGPVGQLGQNIVGG